jgi:hypothetical protein
VRLLISRGSAAGRLLSPVNRSMRFGNRWRIGNMDR